MRLLLVALLLLAPAAHAQPSGAIDATITLAPDAAPAIVAPEGLVRVAEAIPGERYVLDLALPREHNTLEIRANGFDIERPKQLFPSLDVNETTYPLFEPFPTERIWEVEAPANVYHVNGTKDAVVLRLGIVGPQNVTLVLARDVTPPGFELGPVSELQHIGFYQETNTSELALADLQVRAVGATEWIQNPTPSFHVKQRFPVQGLDPDTEYEARVLFRDWSENEATSGTYRVRTTPAPVGPEVRITPIAPEPNATLLPGTVTIRARVESPGSPIDGIRLFFDKREVTDKLVITGEEAAFTPTTPLADGPHSVAFEATNAGGGSGLARWSFTVESGRNESPLAPLAVLAAALALAVALRRR